MELAALRSVVSDRRSRVIGSLPPPDLLISEGSGKPPRPPSPASCEAGSSSRERYLSFRVLRHIPAHGLSATSTFLGVCSPSRHQPEESTFAGVPPPTPFRPRSFSLPRRFTPPPALRVYFTPQPRPGFTLQGLPLQRSRRASSALRALVSFDCARYQRLAPPAPRSQPRLQGLAPRWSPLCHVGG